MLSECLEKAIFSGQETRENHQQTEMGNNCIFPNYVDSKSQFLLSFPFPRTAQRHGNSIGRVGRRVFQRRRKKRGGFPPFPRRQTCGVAAELSRGHTTRIAFPSIHRLKPPHPPASLRTTYTSISLLPATCQRGHQSLSACLAGRINGPSLEQVLTLLQQTSTEPPIRNLVLQHQHRPASRHLCSSVCSMSVRYWRVAAATEEISTGSVKPIHGKM